MTWPKSRSRTSAIGKSIATLSPPEHSTVGTAAGTFAIRKDRTEVAVADVEESDEKIQADTADEGVSRPLPDVALLRDRLLLRRLNHCREPFERSRFVVAGGDRLLHLNGIPALRYPHPVIAP